MRKHLLERYSALMGETPEMVKVAKEMTTRTILEEIEKFLNGSIEEGPLQERFEEIIKAFGPYRPDICFDYMLSRVEHQLNLESDGFFIERLERVYGAWGMPMYEEEDRSWSFVGRRPTKPVTFFMLVVRAYEAWRTDDDPTVAREKYEGIIFYEKEE